ncbi:MAG: hypothetical protein R3E96_16695 [Planctomycetota bacterium]
MFRDQPHGRLIARWVPLLLLSTPLALAQGDDCSDAISLSGFGTFPFDNSAATNSGFSGGGGGCTPFIQQDQFFVWTAPYAGDFQFDTFGTSFDTRLSVHAGADCAATCLGSNDNSGGTLQSLVQVAGVQAGDTLLVQVGSFYLFSGPGQLTISASSTPCGTLTDDSHEPNDSCSSPVALGVGTHTSLFVDVLRPDYFQYTLSAGQILTATVLQDAFGDVDLELLDASCNLLTSGATEVQYQNLSLNAQTVILGAWLDNSTNPSPCALYDLQVTSRRRSPHFLARRRHGAERHLRAYGSHVRDGMYVARHVKKWAQDVYSVCAARGDRDGRGGLPA